MTETYQILQKIQTYRFKNLSKPKQENSNSHPGICHKLIKIKTNLDSSEREKVYYLQVIKTNNSRFSSEILEARRNYYGIFLGGGRKECQPIMVKISWGIREKLRHSQRREN